MKRVNKVAVVSQTKFSNVSYQILLQLFPFGLIIDKDVKIMRTGQKVSDYKFNGFKTGYNQSKVQHECVC